MPRLSKCECVLLEQYKTAPPPSRDYFGIKITENEIHLYKWRICRSPLLFPSIQKVPLKSIEDDQSLKADIEKIFGIEIAVEILKIASGTKDFLSHLPSNIIWRILWQLDLRDIPVVARVCKKLAHQVAGNNDLWFMLFVKYHGKPSKDDINQSEIIGWRKLMYLKRNPTFSRKNVTLGLKVPTRGMHSEKAKSTTTFEKTQKQAPRVSYSFADLKKQVVNRNISKSTKSTKLS